MLASGAAIVGCSALTGVAAHVYFHSYEPSSIFHFLAYPVIAAVFQRTILELSNAQILASLGIWLTALTVSILLYRSVLPFHPLHHIPGPLLAKSTQLSQFRSLVRGRPRIDQQKLHQKYGPVVRIGPNEVSIADTTALSPIFGAKSWEKGKAYSFTASGGAATSETALSAIRDHKEHTARRRIWDRAFAIASLKGYQPSIEHRVQQLCDQLDNICRGDGELDLQEWIGYLVFDVMTDLVVRGWARLRALANVCSEYTVISVSNLLHPNNMSRDHAH